METTIPKLRTQACQEALTLTATTSDRAISASGGSSGAAPGADTTIDLLVGATKPGFYVWKARIYGKYTKLRQERKITPNLITDQSTLINGDFATEIRQFCHFPTRK